MLQYDDKTHTYWDENRQYTSVTTILSYMGLSRDYSGVSSYYSERGKAVHRACEFVDKGTLDDSTLDPRLTGYVQAYRRFIQKTGYKPLHWEMPLHEPSLGFAGTIDKFGELNGRCGIIDIKTSKSLDPSTELQLCGYQVLWNSNNSENHSKFKYALQLLENGDYDLVTKWDSTSVDIWLSVLDTYKWKAKHKKG